MVSSIVSCSFTSKDTALTLHVDVCAVIASDALPWLLSLHRSMPAIVP